MKGTPNWREKEVDWGDFGEMEEDLVNKVPLNHLKHAIVWFGSRPGVPEGTRVYNLAELQGITVPGGWVGFSERYP